MKYEIETIRSWSKSGNATSPEVTLELIAEIDRLKQMDSVQKGIYLESLRRIRTNTERFTPTPAEIAVDGAWEKNHI